MPAARKARPGRSSPARERVATGVGPNGLPRSRSPDKAALAAGLVVVAVSGAAMFLVGVAGSLSFFGQGSAEGFRAWTDRPLLWAGAGGVVVGGAGLVVGLAVAARAVALAVGLAAIAIGVIVLGAGLVAHDRRSRPSGAERRALQVLAVPANRATDVLTLGSPPTDVGVVAGPARFGPPVAVRSWSPSSCEELDRVLAAWADAGSVHVPLSFTASAGFTARTGVSCLWFASHRGYPVRARVQTPPGGGTATATVVISPPGVGP